MGKEIGERVGDGGRVGHAVLPQPFDFCRQPRLRRRCRRREVEVDIPGQAGNALPQGGLVRLLGLLEHVGRGKRQVARGVSHHCVAGLEALDTLFLGLDCAEVSLHVTREAVGQGGDALGRVGEVLFEAGHLWNEGGEGVEVGERVGPHPGDLGTPVGRDQLDLPDEVDGPEVLVAAAVAGECVEHTRYQQQDDRHDRAENDGSSSHGDISSD